MVVFATALAGAGVTVVVAVSSVVTCEGSVVAACVATVELCGDSALGCLISCGVVGEAAGNLGGGDRVWSRGKQLRSWECGGGEEGEVKPLPCVESSTVDTGAGGGGVDMAGAEAGAVAWAVALIVT